MKKNKIFSKVNILGVLILLGHFCFSQTTIDEPFSVVQLKKDSTHIVLEDYFPNIKETAYRITHQPAGMDVRVYKNYEIILYGEQTDPLDYLGISINFIERGIPLKKYINHHKKEGKKNFITTQSFSDGKLDLYRSYPATRLLAFINNRPVEASNFNYMGQKVSITIPEYVKNFSTSDLRIYGFDFDETINDIWLPMSYGTPITQPNVLTQKNYHSSIAYSLILDRFRNGDIKNDMPLNSPEIPLNKDWKGGDLQGIVEMIDKRYFEQMGYNTIILSPVFQNVNETTYTNGELSTPYHGRLPISWENIEPRFGERIDLHRIVGKAHLKKMNVLLGSIFYNVPTSNALLLQNPDWQLSQGTESYFSHRNHSIQLDINKPQVENALIDNMVNIFREYAIDGFAYLDTETLPKKTWSKMRKRMINEVALPQRRNLFQMIEAPFNEEIYDTGMVNSYYDIDFSEVARETFFNETNAKKLGIKLNEKLESLGSHNLVANISGSEYMDRDMSLIKEVDEEIAWDKMKQFFVFNSTIPGIPITFYGDEIGMKGEGVDGHRLMRFSDLDIEENDFRNFVAGINKLRRNQMALMYGETDILQNTEKSLVFSRTYLDNKIIVAFNTSADFQSFKIELPDYLRGRDFTPRYFTSTEKTYRELSFTIKPYGFEIFISR